MPYHSRATANLRAGRLSLSEAWYFLTWCTHDRRSLLTAPEVRLTLHSALTNLDRVHDGTVLAATIMPDHVHLPLRLGARLSVSQVVAKIKATATRQHPGVKWQANFFEHRLRDPASAEDFAFYIFMNPYVGKLCGLHEVWPGWMPSPQIRWSFEDQRRDGKFPQAEWLPVASRLAGSLPVGGD